MQEQIKQMMSESAETKVTAKVLSGEIEESIKLIIGAFKRNRKILLAGNGGSASQASHIAAEFIGRYKIERRGLPAIALTCDTSVITAWSNDYGYNTLFQRQIEALGQEGDIFISFSTSGNSENLIKAIESAKGKKIITISLLGKNGGKMKGLSDLDIIVPSDNTPRIQEVHLMIMHIVCELVDEKLFGKGNKNA